MTTWFPHQHRTANDGITFEGEATGGGGGSGGVQTVTVPVSSAQILDIGNTPVVLIPGVPGSVTVVNGIALVYLAGGTPYTDPGNSLDVRTAVVASAPWLFRSATGFWDQAASQVIVQGDGGGGQLFIDTLANFDGADVILHVDAGSPTLGDGTLLVTVSYFLAPTV